MMLNVKLKKLRVHSFNTPRTRGAVATCFEKKKETGDLTLSLSFEEILLLLLLFYKYDEVDEGAEVRTSSSSKS
jgi:hypothetical protein